MSTEIAQALTDLIWERERLNGGLSEELSRSQRIANAATQLKALNDHAEALVIDTLQRIGRWPPPIEQHEPYSIPPAARQTRAENAAEQIFRGLN